MSKHTILIVVEGGIVQEVLDLPEDVDYQVVDLDATEYCGCDPDERDPLNDPRISKNICWSCGGEIEENEDDSV